jgi:hypothetical protein
MTNTETETDSIEDILNTLSMVGCCEFIYERCPPCPNSYFSRDIRISCINNVEISIEWWVNQSYVDILGCKIPFKHIEISGTWPNRYKTNMQFYNGTESPCLIIPIERCKS